MEPVFFLCILPLLLIGGFALFSHFLEQRKYREFFRKHEGTEFFCYTNRQNSKLFIEGKILPHLDPFVEIIYMQDRKPISRFDDNQISHVLYRIKNVGFPNVMKIVNGKIIDLSLHHELYETINQGKPATNFLATVEEKLHELRNM